MAVGRLALVVSIALCLVGAVEGCKKSEPQGEGEAPSIVVLPSALNPDGTLNETGLKLIHDHAADPKIYILVMRAPLSDAGLAQIVKFPNVRRIDARTSKITDKGIAAAKAVIPEIEVSR